MNSSLEQSLVKTRVKTVSGENKYAPILEEYENPIQINKSFNLKQAKKESQNELINDINDIAKTAFHNAANEAIGLGHPINIDLNGITIILNPDKTYEVIKTKEKELNTFPHIYL